MMSNLCRMIVLLINVSSFFNMLVFLTVANSSADKSTNNSSDNWNNTPYSSSNGSSFRGFVSVDFGRCNNGVTSMKSLLMDYSVTASNESNWFSYCRSVRMSSNSSDRSWTSVSSLVAHGNNFQVGVSRCIVINSGSNMSLIMDNC